MTRIEKIIKEIDQLRDFYKRTESLRSKIQKKETERLIEISRHKEGEQFNDGILKQDC